jgi:hypothetical protein
MVKPFRRTAKRTETPETLPAAGPVATAEPIPIPDHDPLMGYLLGAGGPVDIDKIELDSPALRELRQAGVHLVVPLISQGELIGTLNLGKRLSDQPYSSSRRPRQRSGNGSTRSCGSPHSSSRRCFRKSFRRWPAGRSTPTTAQPGQSAATSTTSSPWETVASGS